MPAEHRWGAEIRLFVLYTGLLGKPRACGFPPRFLCLALSPMALDFDHQAVGRVLVHSPTSVGEGSLYVATGRGAARGGVRGACTSIQTRAASGT